ncbi:thiol peroxidase [Helicobacter cappadocius]|uniref:Thiol peroxidase n=1 Tax=Helicobacter cappadocius TaxID=3063998 RepID=A0AA90T598_9HELI|nr:MULTISPECIES: thiol peroxidase [unclassified Helicobacter]MDO7253275.1 thiol peroxidase [Helicobacter sp. faydin-H75]MDP2539198.1 thiol peroxidase [Helicobacter sp. faydin-H76]
MSVKFKGTPVTLSGKQINVGENAPLVTLVGKDLGEVKVGGASGKYQIINVVPSLDTGVCATQTRKFNEKAASISNAVVMVVSMDLPFAQGRFCSTEGIENLVVASDFRSKTFGQNYGVLLAGSPLEGVLTRAVFVVDPNGKLVYKEVCEEITQEPDYNKPLEAIK